MEKTLIQSLRLLGCNEKQIRFYQANLELGATTLMVIAKKANLQRSTAYLIAAEMVQLGLASEDLKSYRKLFIAAEPDTVLRKLEAKQRQVGRASLALKEVLPELRAAHHATTTRPRVRTFEGKTGLIAVWKDILAKQQEVLLWTNQKTERQFFDPKIHELFIRERIEKGIPTRVLAVDNKKAANCSRLMTELSDKQGFCLHQQTLLVKRMSMEIKSRCSILAKLFLALLQKTNK